MRKSALFILVLGGALLYAQAPAGPPSPRKADAPEDSVIDATRSPPFNMEDRVRWALTGAVDPKLLAGFSFSAALRTASNSPEEYGPHWDGFAKRVGMSASSAATGRMMEAGIGALWGEDPRYARATGRPLKKRILNIVKSSVMAYDGNGNLRPAYARYIAVPANSFLTNAWRADSHATAGHALRRIPISFVTEIIGNAASEFWPDITKRFRRSGERRR